MLAKMLKELRKRDNKTQEEFAVKLGIARSTYSGYERGTSEPDNETLDKIANYYSVSIDFLLGRTADPNRVLKEQARTLIDLVDLDLTDEEIMSKMNLRVDGMTVEKDEVKIFIRLVREGREKVNKALQEFSRGTREKEKTLASKESKD